jgi:hypothetical protein
VTLPSVAILTWMSSGGSVMIGKKDQLFDEVDSIAGGNSQGQERCANLWNLAICTGLMTSVLSCTCQGQMLVSV